MQYKHRREIDDGGRKAGTRGPVGGSTSSIDRESPEPQQQRSSADSTQSVNDTGPHRIQVAKWMLTSFLYTKRHQHCNRETPSSRNDDSCLVATPWNVKRRGEQETSHEAVSLIIA